ncbi:MAG: lysoplasmalogenase family protein [Acidovorax sp.]|jgi:sterol desaturase/sphingolipid hydroxylase (fatty acid hydroxylase superfamily)/uncharacterized membrane protein YhhN|nr:lysoplasmalogenase family protein [Acidovorax sp.]
MYSPSQVIVLVTPVFFALMALEWAVARRRGRRAYRQGDAISSLNLGMLSQTSAVFAKLLAVGIYTVAVEHLALVRNDAFWLSLPGWLLALLFYDFCYYWLHRMGHEVAVLWAAHAVHHQSQDYNLSTALRQTSSGVLLAWIFYLPMALAGVPPLVFVVVGLIDLLYQFWVHTEQVGRLGWFDRWFCAPSNHRVHHAINDRYVDRNYGGILMVWDRMFGTFQPEETHEPCVYGTRGLLNSWDPLWANATIYRQLLHDSWHAKRLSDKLRVWLKPPGWRPADVAQRFPKPAFDLEAHRQLFDPPLSRAMAGFAWLQFVALAAGAAAFLWHADQASLTQNLLWFGVLLTGQWTLGAAMQGRISLWMALLLQSAALATATAALGLREWHWLFKPLTLAIALVYVATYANQALVSDSEHGKKQKAWILGALFFSLLGDICLMLDGLFIPGLVCFLLAHLCYTACFRCDAPWLAHRGALLGISLLACVVYTFLCLGGLPAALRLPVLAYVAVIALMAAQAWGRFAVQGGQPAWLVALGSSFFMASDTLLATDRFVQQLPWATAGVLSTYFVAQALMVQGCINGLRQAAGKAAIDGQAYSANSPPGACGATSPR